MGFFRRKRRINLALQGGGAHGAFTWGVLDRLLEDERLEIGWVSATSAGAVNAAAMAAGLARGGPPEARRNLGAVWEAIYRAGVPDFLKRNPFLYSLSRSPALAQVASLWSPYDFNPLGFDPLRRLLEETIDFELVRTSAPVELLIAATDVASGRARLFRRGELTIDALLASACLPTMHHALVIEGRAYWDGGFSANPDLVTLGMESPVGDTVIVQINPLEKGGLPTGVREIADHANRLTFNAPLIRDVEIIETVRATAGASMFGARGPMGQLARHRFHLIEAGEYTRLLRPESKVKADLGLFQSLFAAGRVEADKWLAAHARKIGRRGSVDLGAHYLPSTRSRVPLGRGGQREAMLSQRDVDAVAKPPHTREDWQAPPGLSDTDEGAPQEPSPQDDGRAQQGVRA